MSSVNDNLDRKKKPHHKYVTLVGLNIMIFYFIMKKI